MPANEEAHHRLLFHYSSHAWIVCLEPLIHCAHSTKLEQTNKCVQIWMHRSQVCVADSEKQRSLVWGGIHVRDLFFLPFSKVGKNWTWLKVEEKQPLERKRLIIQETRDDIPANNKTIINLVFTWRPFWQGGFPEPLNEVTSPIKFFCNSLHFFILFFW